MERRSPAAHRIGQKENLAELKRRLSEAEETLRAIRGGEVDALVVDTPEGEQVYTLRGAEATYRILVEAMNEGALLLMPDGTVLYANTRFAAMTGLTLDQIISCPVFKFVPEEEGTKLQELLKQAQHSGVSSEFQLRVAPGRFCPVWISVSSTKAAGIDGFSAVVTDLTERKAAEAKVQEMVGELEGVSYAIVHDMRAPLRAMEAFAYMLEQDSAGQTPVQRKDLARRIATAASRLDELIRDALAYNEVVLRPTTLHPVDLSKLLRELRETYPNLADDKVDLDVAENLPVVLGNEGLLTQCFANLLGNAVKFVAKGVRPRVRVWAETNNGMARIRVEDNGIGIPAHAQERLFGMFQRLTSEYEGTGIGLAIVRKVAERLGGRVGAESQPGRGSCFWVELRADQGGEARCTAANP
ncbi:MAG TPA: PAS domain-containing sensor histidine kinase [Verrucomicrobiae bacterium]|nr:PAS domain-containing sensor histidine kinase [Verrucomicrobiae bacterium]